MNTYHRLSMSEREEISRGIWAGEQFTTIADRIGRSPSTVSRELWRDVRRKSRSYSAVRSQERAAVRAKKGRYRKLDYNAMLKEYVYAKLRTEWSPEEIAERLKLEYPQEKAMRVSHETIYQHLYCLPKGELKRELMRGLRRNRKRRLSRDALHYRRQKIPDAVSIHDRTPEARSRAVPGHWEGDLVMGKDRASAIGTLVERTTRLTLIVPLKTKDAEAVRHAFAHAFIHVPAGFKRSLAYDRGSEMSEHKLFTADTQIQVYFADPHSPWQRGTNENTNGLIRQYFPKGTDFRKVPRSALRRAEERLNARPRKSLGFYTPAEKFYQLVTGLKIALET